MLLAHSGKRPGTRRKPTRHPVGLGAISLLAMLPVLALLFLPASPHTNTPIVPGETVEANLQVPPPVVSILYRACGNCHSDRTVWPWYSRIKPFSWLIEQDVNEARSVMNFSRWTSGPGASPGSAVSWLTMTCADVQAGRMPLRRYVLLHPESRLSSRDVATLCDWTSQEISRLSAAERSEQARRLDSTLSHQ